MPEAYVTLATNNGYAAGALVLAHSLRSCGTTKDLCIIITPAVSPDIKSLLEQVFNAVVTVDVLDSGDSAHLALMKRPELGVTFTKFHCWTLTQYTKCVFLDADMLAVQNPDELFSHPELTAVCDIGWPDCFNSGMFVFVPSQETYAKLLHMSETTGSFDGGDQGILNTFFPNWNRVSFVFNMVASATYTYLPAYKQFGGNARLVHFLGATKPWHYRFDSSSGTVQTGPGYQHLTPYLNSWWAIYTRLVKPNVPEMDVQKAVEVKSPVETIQDVQEISSTVHSNDESCSTCSVNGDCEVKSSRNLTSKVGDDTESTQCVSFSEALALRSDIEPSVCVCNAGSDRGEEPQIAQQISGMHIGAESLQEGQARWERGEPDYLGRDSFANIQAYIDSKIKGNGK